ncbi:hypothetical protein TSAR_008579 [Trichomalopsis sarcophagae]|uniref:Uncharacterized protein n=1 Tax=Trichomalopsis sarcophagae TaxID=543379 RepID=A0A232FCD8_9HYME|nr:hypothetical protein TSAR_008579 [Trichomalopsis sarcophagae]
MLKCQSPCNENDAVKRRLTNLYALCTTSMLGMGPRIFLIPGLCVKLVAHALSFSGFTIAAAILNLNHRSGSASA